MLKNAHFPSPIAQRIGRSRAEPRNMLVKIFQGEAANVPFKANVWDLTGIEVSDGLLKPKIE